MKKNTNVIPVMIIGSAKAGTTTLFSYIKRHPLICPCVVKEPEFFSRKIGMPKKLKYKEGDYWDLFDLNKDIHRFTLEGSTGYTKYPAEKGVPKRISECGLAPLFIYIVRNPFDRIRSHWNFMQYDSKWNLDITSKYLLDVSNYYQQLMQYVKFFKKDRILVLKFEELKQSPSELLSKVFAFLKLPMSSMIFEEIHANRTVVVSPMKLKFEKYFEGKVDWIPGSIRKKIKAKLSEKFRKDQLSLSESQRDLVYKYLKNDMIKLREEWGVEVGEWGF